MKINHSFQINSLKLKNDSKQLKELRKLKFKLERNYLEKIYLIFIRPILEYASEVWLNCGQFNSNRLEKNAN